MGKYLDEFYRVQSQMDNNNANKVQQFKLEFNQLLQKEQALKRYLSSIGYPAMMTDPKLTEWRNICSQLSKTMNAIEKIQEKECTFKEWTEGFSEREV